MTTIKRIKDSNGVSHELDSKYWGGKETLKTINGEELFGEGNIDISVSESNSIIEVIYDDLCELRNNNSLVPGQQYRITDYVTTTVQENTESAYHQFDIIVTANSSNTLSEIASACIHEGDTYFSENNANLSAWQILYCLDNDVDRFEWATDMGYSYDSDNNLYEFNKWVTAVGKVVYDEQIDTFYGGEINEKFSHFGYSEDLDGIQRLTLYGRNLDGDIDEGLDMTQLYHYKGVFTVDGKEYDGWAQLVIGEDGIGNYATFEGTGNIYILTKRIVNVNSENIIIGKGVIYKMTDEFNNTLPYDFKNIQFKRFCSEYGYVGVDGFEDWSKLIFDKTDYKYLYTFSMIGETDVYDTSLNIYSNSENHLSVRNNCYLPNTINGKLYLNNIVHVCSESLEEGFVCEGVENTKTGVNCYNISLKDKCDNWVLGNHCHDIIMNMNCGGWVCEDECYNLIFGLNCSSWKLGHNCYNVSVGGSCIEWVCGDDCSGWSTDTNNSNWNCGSDCSNWETGPDCNYWVCGNKCHNWKTGSNCSYWTCGNNCHTWEVSEGNSFWTCGNGSYYWKVENYDCRNFNICNGVHGTSSTDKLLLDFPAYTALTKQQQINASFNEYDMLTIWNPASPINYPIIKRTDTGPSASECIYLAPNVYNIWINNKLPNYVTLSMPKSDMVGEYILRFTIPSTVTNHSLVFSNEIKWVNNDIPTWDAGYTYEISIVDGYATFLKYSL